MTHFLAFRYRKRITLAACVLQTLQKKCNTNSTMYYKYHGFRVQTDIGCILQGNRNTRSGACMTIYLV